MTNEEILDRWLNNRLTPDERADFEARLASDTELAAKAAAYKIEHEAMDLMLEQDLRAQMQQWEAEMPLEEVTTNEPTPTHKQPAIVLLLLLVAVGFGIIAWMNQNKTEQPALNTPAPALPQQQIAPTQPQQTTNLEQPIASTTNQTKPIKPVIEQTPTTVIQAPAPPDAASLIARAEALYSDKSIVTHYRGAAGTTDALLIHFENREFEQVIQMTENIPPNSASFYGQLELRAHALFQRKKYKEAANCFSILACGTQEPFAERSQWFLVLSYMAQLPAKQEQYNSALNKIIIDEEHSYYPKAIELKQ
jgi:hypothetical protein